MNFVANKDEAEKEQQDKSALEKMKEMKGIVKCRYCKEDHWTTQCPYKDTLGPLRDSLMGPGDEADGGPEGGAAASPAAAAAGGGGGAGGKYVPPSRRGMSDAQARITGDSMPDRRREDTAAIRVSNLSENVQEGDLQVGVIFSFLPS